MTAPTKTRRAGDQPLPTAGQVEVGALVVKDVSGYANVGHSQRVVDAVIADFEARIELGIKRYGHPLQTLNGRDAGQDALDELYDAAHYLKQLHLEQGEARIQLAYWSVLGLIFDLKTMRLSDA